MADAADAYMKEQLMLMGFDQETVTAALIATNNRSVDAALEALLNQTYTLPSKNPENPVNPVPNPIKQQNALLDAKAIEKAIAEEREVERRRVEKLRREKEEKREEKMRARRENSDDDEDEDLYDYDDDDEDEDEEMGDEGLDDEIRAAKVETAVVLDQTQIQESAAKEIERIATITDTSLSTAGALLRAFQWNSEKLLEKYYENPEKVMKDAGVTSVVASKGGALRTSANPIKAKPTECEICGDDLDANNSCSLECQHVFCHECLARYLEVQISEGKSLDITCMAFKCTGRVPDQLIRALTSAPLYSKYTAFVSKSFVEDNPNIQWCPRAGCGNAVKSDVKSISEAKCSCGFKFCFKCNGEAHAPASCTMMKAWTKKCQDDSETSNWISTNTKDCPKCKSAIEKNGGCNHMTCRKCKYEFCWICMGDWKGHSNCNKFVEDSSKSMDRAALERYLHYFHRYDTHEQSKKFEQTLRQSAVVKMVSIQNTDSNRWIDVQYIDQATEQLIECRRTLKYTYVFAFYMINGPEKNLFEYLQAELEKTTEQLSGFLEAPTGTHTPRQIKDVTGLAGKRLQHLREGVEEMMDASLKPPILAEVSEHKQVEVASKPQQKTAEKEKGKTAAPAATGVPVTSGGKTGRWKW